MKATRHTPRLTANSLEANPSVRARRAVAGFAHFAPAIRARRPGAALVIALLMLVVLDCVVVGTLHLSLQEHRIGGNRSMILRLRLDAESGARRSLAFWSTEIDTMRAGSDHRLAIPAAATGTADVEIERLDARLFLIRSVATEPAPRVGRSTAQLLVLPPALPPNMNPAAAPLSAGGAVRVLASGVIRSAAPLTCTTQADAGFSVLTADPGTVVVDAGGEIDAPSGSTGSGTPFAPFDRIAALAPNHRSVVNAATDTVVSGSTRDTAEVLIVSGNLTVRTGAGFSGLAIVRGSVTIEPGATVRGAVHALAGATVGGTIQWDACLVAAAIDLSGLDRPTPAGARAWLPF